MAQEALIRFAETLMRDNAGQRTLQNVLNDLAAALVEAGKTHGCEFSVEDVGGFLTTTFYPDGSTPAGPVYDRKQWSPVLQGMLQQLKVSNPDHQMFQTMSLDMLGADEQAVLQSALQAASAGRKAAEPEVTPAAPTPAPQPAPAAPRQESQPAAPAAPAPQPVAEESHDVFEPDEAYGAENPGDSAVNAQLEEAHRRIQAMEQELSGASGQSSWWKKLW